MITTASLLIPKPLGLTSIMLMLITAVVLRIITKTITIVLSRISTKVLIETRENQNKEIIGMKKTNLFLFLISVSVMSAVTETTNRSLSDEAKIIFSFDGPQNITVSLFQNGQFLKTIPTGNTFEKTVPNGRYVFVAQIGENDSIIQTTAGNNRLSKELTVYAENKSVYVKITASIKPSGVVIDEFAVTNIVQLPPEPGINSGGDKEWALGASIGTSFAAPLVIGTFYGNYTPFKGSFFKDTFLELGMDIGLGIYRPDIQYFSLYPFVNYALFTPFPRPIGGIIYGWYAGLGLGAMFANYIYDVAGPIWDSTVAINFVAGINIFEMIDVSYTLRTNFKSADSKLSVGYVYRF